MNMHKNKQLSKHTQRSSPAQRMENKNAGVVLTDNRPGSVAQLASKAQFNATAFDLGDDTKEMVGHEMTAHIDHTDPIQGSAPGDGVQSLLMGTLKSEGYMRMIRGHLLNGQFGGLGIAANLFPITSSANSKHKNHVENPIKQQIKKGKDIDYSVTVQSANDISNPDAKFVCDAKATDNSWKRKETIESTPSKVKKSNSAAEGKALKGTDTASFRSSDMPKGFGESGKGFTGTKSQIKTAGKYSMKFNGKSQEVDDNLYASGAHFNKGKIDRAGYARELLDKYVEDIDQWPIYFGSKKYDEDAISEVIDEDDEADIERIIKRLEALI